MKGLKVKIKCWYGGNYGVSGEYTAIVKPYYFKTGNLRKTKFDVLKVVDTIKKGYGYGNCQYSESIVEVYGEVEL